MASKKLKKFSKLPLERAQNFEHNRLCSDAVTTNREREYYDLFLKVHTSVKEGINGYYFPNGKVVLPENERTFRFGNLKWLPFCVFTDFPGNTCRITGGRNTTMELKGDYPINFLDAW